MDFEALAKPLDKKHVSTREQAGRTLSYIEGHHAIREANRIFGFDGWKRETVYCKEVCRYEYNGKHKVGYEAMVRITVGNVVREGTGHGQAVNKDVFDCIEGAAKEAETDAMKRALMTFGDQFGLALYDKEKKHVAIEPQKPAMTNQQHADAMQGILACNTVEELKALYKSIEASGVVIPSDINKLTSERKKELENG